MGAGKNTTTSTQTLPAEIQDDITGAFGQYSPVTKTAELAAGIDPEVYRGARVAGLTAPQTEGIASLSNLLDSNPFSPARSGVSNLLSGSAINKEPLSAFNPRVAPQLREALTTAATDATNNIASQFNLSGRFGDNDAFGSGLSRGVTDAIGGILAPVMQRDADRELAVANALLDADARNAGLVNTGASSLVNLLQGEQGLAQNVIGAGGVEQATNQAILEGQRALVDEQNAADMTKLNALLSAAGLGSLAPTSTTEVEKKKPGLLDYLTVAASAASAF